MVKFFAQLAIGVVVAVLALGWFWPPALVLLVIIVPLIVLGLFDAFQTKQAVRRNFPVLGHARYLFELIRPEIQQYFVESETNGAPVPRMTRSVVYQRSKKALQTIAFGSQLDFNQDGYEWVNHSIAPLNKATPVKDLRVTIGGPQCQQPYSASLLNISAMSYGALSKNAVMALNKGAKEGGFYHNTGEGGISPYHKMGGDLVWQIGTGYFGCRRPDGTFSEELFAQKAKEDFVKMIEIKISQGAKPGHGGILPASKVTPEIAAIRDVPLGQDVMSPPRHSAFSTPRELLQFVQKLRDLSGGKPVGFKLCVGSKTQFISICKAMQTTGILPDFITVDGGEGGTGAAPLEFINSIGAPLNEGLHFVHDTLRGFNLREHIRIIASGKVMTGMHILTKLALGADLVNSARGMMFSMGCIQALRCNSNHCPVGVATSNPSLMRGLVVEDKYLRVANFQYETLHAFSEMLGAMGYHAPHQVKRQDINRRISNNEVKSYEGLYPSVPVGAYLHSESLQGFNAELRLALETASPENF